MEIPSYNTNTPTSTYYNSTGAEVTEEKNKNNSFEYELGENKSSKETNSSNNEENKQTAKELQAITDHLLENLNFIMKTGMTKDEYEALQELLEKIKQEMKNENKSSDDLKQLDDLISDLEKMVAIIQKRITGEAIIEVSDKNDLNVVDKKDSGKSPEEIKLLGRIQNINEAITNLRDGNEKKDLSSANTSEELELLHKLKQNS